MRSHNYNAYNLSAMLITSHSYGRSYLKQLQRAIIMIGKIFHSCNSYSLVLMKESSGIMCLFLLKQFSETFSKTQILLLSVNFRITNYVS